MIGPAEVAARAGKWWPEVLRAAVTGEAVFPRDVPRIGKVTTRTSVADFDRIRLEQERLLAGVGGAYTLHWREIDTRALGRNRFIERISVDSLPAYLKLTKRAGDYAIFMDILARSRVPGLWGGGDEIKPDGLREVFLRKPEKLLAYADAWPDLLRVVKYFGERHERNKFYIRELPVDVPTKFIESHRVILAELLDATLPAALIDDAHRGVKGFEARYGLRDREPLVRLRLLDRAMADQYFSGVSDLSIPLRSLQTLHLRPRRIIMLENKTTYESTMGFLTLPGCRGTLAIFGSGFAAGALKEVEWLRKTPLYYWGDLDAAGFQIVNQVRAHFPHLRTLLMDRKTLNAFPEYHVTVPPLPPARLQYLTEEELSLYDYLNANGLRLEQERVPVGWVRVRVQKLK